MKNDGLDGGTKARFRHICLPGIRPGRRAMPEAVSPSYH